jgi:hypothetical protein
MDRAELFAMTARLRRSFPRHGDVLAVCDEVERLARVDEKPSVTIGGHPKRDRAAYMRDYRAKKRA